MAELKIPDLSLVVLVGVSGSGKSTFAARHFAPTQILSSDYFRGLVADDPDDQAATADAFDALHHVAGLRLRAGRITVVDATNVQRSSREPLVALAREHHVLPVAIVLDLPEALCQERVAAGRGFGPHVVRRQRGDLRRSLRGLEREGFRRVHVMRSVEEIDAAGIVVEPLLNDKRSESGPFDVIGDVHGCRNELVALLAKLGYAVRDDGASHPDGRRVVFVGDLVDRGPDTPGVLRLVMGMVRDGDAFAVCGNHEQKLVRALNGRKVTISHGLAESLAQLGEERSEFREDVRRFCDALVSHYVLDGGRLVVAHAGLPERYHGRASGRVRSFALYGDTTGETDEFGLPVRYPWARDYRGAATVVYGHTPVPSTEWINNTLCVDTGAVFGGALTALRWPEREVVSVPAERVWCEPKRPLSPLEPVRDPFVLDLGDVAGKRIVETGTAGRVTVHAERAAAALEVMSRFAVDPRWLVYLPPTMAPPEVSAREGYLEHPDEAFAAFRDAGVGEVVCEEKHMGSRAVVLVCRDPDRFGIDGPGVVVTRTGRSFFDDARTAALLARVRDAAAGLFDELASDWLLLDAELLPWSAKAEGLLRGQFAPVAAAAEAGLSAAGAALAAAAARGVDVGALASRVADRRAAAAGFRAAYRRYCWPVGGPDGLDGVQLAPFALLAAQDRTFAAASHRDHLAWTDRLVDADPVLFRRTERRFVALDDPAAVTGAVDWWESLTEAGGEGMVVKPLVPVSRVQPGIKVRGREYLRLVYGPDYPAHLDRLRGRHTGLKRSLALREHALGVEGLERLARGEPLWRVHECVFAVLALESEPVDPRL